MFHKRYQPKHLPKSNGRGKTTALILSLCLIFTAVVGGTLAYLFDKTDSVNNTFIPAHVTTDITEDFDGEVKKNVNVKNTGDIDVYVRVKLVTYRVNDEGQHIGGTAEIPAFTPGANWVKYGEYYYYTLKVAPGSSPATALIGSEGIKLVSYTDSDGGKQVIEVMAEAIQAEPEAAVGEAWNVKISPNSVSSYSVD